MFVLEDVHWADEATLDVLRLLARRVESVPALVVASYRDDGLDRSHPLRILIGELATSQAVGRVKLGRLSPGAVARLAEPYGVDADELYRKTGGNPFFVVEALASGTEGSRTWSGTRCSPAPRGSAPRLGRCSKPSPWWRRTRSSGSGGTRW